MDRPPSNPNLPILQKGHWLFISFYAVLISVAALGSLIYAMDILGMERHEARTVSFLVVTFGQLLHVFNVRSRNTGILSNDVTRNFYVWLAIGISMALTLLMLYVPVLASVMQLAYPGPAVWLTGIAFSLVPLITGQVHLALRDRSGR